MSIEATVTLPPGEYVLAAHEVSAKDGSRVSPDTKPRHRGLKPGPVNAVSAR